jgi:hypothetical protein
MREYFHSFDNEVYPMILPKAFHDMLFEEVQYLHLFLKHTPLALHTKYNFSS